MNLEMLEKKGGGITDWKKIKNLLGTPISKQKYTFKSDVIDKTIESPIGRYVVIKDNTPLLIEDKTKKDIYGDVGTRVIKTLNKGDFIEVVKKGGGGRGALMTPYLILSDGSYIVAYNAKKVNNSSSEVSTYRATDTTKKIFTAKNILIVSASVLSVYGLLKLTKII